MTGSEQTGEPDTIQAESVVTGLMYKRQVTDKVQTCVLIQNTIIHPICSVISELACIMVVVIGHTNVNACCRSCNFRPQGASGSKNPTGMKG